MGRIGYAGMTDQRRTHFSPFLSEVLTRWEMDTDSYVPFVPPQGMVVLRSAMTHGDDRRPNQWEGGYVTTHRDLYPVYPNINRF